MLSGGFDRKAFVTEIRGAVCTQTDDTDQYECKTGLKERFATACPEGAANEEACAAQFKLKELEKGKPATPPSVTPPATPPAPVITSGEKSNSGPYYYTIQLLHALLGGNKEEEEKFRMQLKMASTAQTMLAPMLPHFVRAIETGKYGKDYDQKVLGILTILPPEKVGPAVKHLIPQLRALLKEEKEVTTEVALILATIGPEAAEAVPDLIQELQHLPGTMLKMPPKEEIEKLSPWATAWITALTIVVALEYFGQEAAPAISALKKIAEENPDEPIGKEAKKAIAKIQGTTTQK